MKKKLTTVAVLGLVVACGFAQPAEAGFGDWFKSNLKSAVSLGLKTAGKFVADRYCEETPSSKALKFKMQAGTCAMAVHTKNHGIVKYKAVTGGVPAILGAEPTSGSDEDTWSAGWIDFLATKIGAAWYSQAKDKDGAVPRDIKDLVGDELEDKK